MKPNTGITLDSLNPQFRKNFERWTATVEAAYPQFKVRITCTRRTAQQAAQCTEMGDRCDGVPDLSTHQYGLVVDIQKVLLWFKTPAPPQAIPLQEHQVQHLPRKWDINVLEETVSRLSFCCTAVGQQNCHIWLSGDP